jgi:hypothetical protein
MDIRQTQILSALCSAGGLFIAIFTLWLYDKLVKRIKNTNAFYICLFVLIVYIIVLSLILPTLVVRLF